MDYTRLDPHYTVSELREVLRDLDDETVDQLSAGDVLLTDISSVDAACLTADDITVLRDLAQADEY